MHARRRRGRGPRPAGSRRARLGHAPSRRRAGRSRQRSSAPAVQPTSCRGG
jgi:hypothetical protein